MVLLLWRDQPDRIHHVRTDAGTSSTFTHQGHIMKRTLLLRHSSQAFVLPFLELCGSLDSTPFTTPSEAAVWSEVQFPAVVFLVDTAPAEKLRGRISGAGLVGVSLPDLCLHLIRRFLQFSHADLLLLLLDPDFELCLVGMTTLGDSGGLCVRL